MLSFRRFIIEQEEEASEGASRQIKHLTHIEDRPLQNGSKGAQHAIASLNAAAQHIKSGSNNSELTTKYDGSPAIVYGHHPETGKFFVASKSAFNKTPKINYNQADIEKNHGHAPGLADKLKAALQHLPKIAPKQGVYQGDMMFTHEDKKSGPKGSVSFNPNPSGITYTAHGDSANKVKKAKVGVVTHLMYHGKDSSSLNASHGVDHESFKHHPDVFTVDPRMDTSAVHFSPKQQSEFKKHLTAAANVHQKHGENMYALTKQHQGVGSHLETFINHTIKTDKEPNHENFKNFIEGHYNKAIDKLKTDKNKNQKKSELIQHLHHIERNKDHYNNLFKMHQHLQKAKNVLVDVMNQHQDFEHTHGGEKANPEGYVYHHGGESDKLINRAEFSKRNFANRTF